MELAADTFVARGGRQLGFLLERVGVRPRTPGTWPPWSLVAILGLPALVVLLTARVAGLPPWGALVLAAGLLGVESAALWPYGLREDIRGVTIDADSLETVVLALVGEAGGGDKEAR